jgi:hypothetical protein
MHETSPLVGSNLIGVLKPDIHFQILLLAGLISGVGILFDETQTKGMHYIAIRLSERFMSSENERQEAVEAIRQMLTCSYSGEKSMCSAADRSIKRIEKRNILEPKV